MTAVDRVVALVLGVDPDVLTCPGCRVVSWVVDVQAYGLTCPACRRPMFGELPGRRVLASDR